MTVCVSSSRTHCWRLSGNPAPSEMKTSGKTGSCSAGISVTALCSNLTKSSQIVPIPDFPGCESSMRETHEIGDLELKGNSANSSITISRTGCGKE